MLISKEELLKIVEKNMSNYEILGPVMTDKVLDFKVIMDINDLIISDGIPYKSPKEIYFPQKEKVISFTEDMNIKEYKTSDKKLLIGAKPCDLKALHIMSTVFTKGNYIDDVFQNNILNTTTIGIGCEDMKNGCFCDIRGIEKNYSEFCDIFLEVTDKGYNVNVYTEKGQAIFSEIEITNKSEKVEDGTLVLGDNEIELFEKIDWEKYTRKCLGCGICTYVCPTCHCFEFKDIKTEGQIDRYRCWDSCMNPKFTLHASGHNPRNSRADRYRQRVMHKFSYVKKNFGYTACTGCGRCIRSCPTGMNIKTIVENIMEETS